MFEKIKIKEHKPMTVAYIRHEGDYKEIPYGEYIDRLYQWSRRLRARPSMKPMSIYLDHPDEKQRSDVRTDIALPIRKKIEGEGKIKVRDLPATKVVTMKFKGSPDDYESAYSELWKWIEERNYKISGPSMEFYIGRPKKVKGKQVIKSRIEIPIK